MAQQSKPAPITISARPEVAAFAELMEAKLAQNDHKPGWQDMPIEWLFSRFCDEAEELRVAIAQDDLQNTVREAIDVGNFSMFIADVACGLDLGVRKQDEATVLLQRIYNFLSVSIGILGPRLDPNDERAQELWKIYRDIKNYLGGVD